jgi:hypothetical protein
MAWGDKDWGAAKGFCIRVGMQPAGVGWCRGCDATAIDRFKCEDGTAEAERGSRWRYVAEVGLESTSNPSLIADGTLSYVVGRGFCGLCLDNDLSLLSR